MAWNAQKNEIFFQRAQNWASAVVNLLEERDRLIDLYVNEVDGDPAFIDTEIATTAELIALAGVMNALDALVNDGTVAKANRVPLLTPFLNDQL